MDDAQLAFAHSLVGTDLAKRHALAIDILLHAGRLAGFAELAQRATGDREHISPQTWLQAAKADLQALKFAAQADLVAALPHAAATISESLLENGMRCSAACSLFAHAAASGVEGLEPREVPQRSFRDPYPATVRATRALPTARRRPTERTEMSDEQADQLAIAMATNARNAKIDERLHRDAAMAHETIYPDDDLDSAAASALRQHVRDLAYGNAPLVDVSGIDLVDHFDQPLPESKSRPTAILIAIDMVRDPYRAAIVRSNSKRSDLQVGRILTGAENDLIREWQLTGVRVYLARASYEYEAGATCLTHPWGRTQGTTKHIDQQTGRVVRVVHGGDLDYIWAERYDDTGKGQEPNARARAVQRATNACPICALPSGPAISSASRAAVSDYDVLRLAAVMAYKAEHGRWPRARGEVGEENLLVDREGVVGKLGRRPDPVLEGVHYRVVHDLQADYVARAEALYTHRFGRTKDPVTPEQMRLKWAWVARQPGFGERPLDRFTVAIVRADADEPTPNEIRCVGEPEREASNADVQAQLDVAHRHQA